MRPVAGAGSARNANKYGVAMELQADCFAGAWGRMADDRGNVTVTDAEVRQAQNAASAVGDDRIQQASGDAGEPGDVDPRLGQAA